MNWEEILISKNHSLSQKRDIGRNLLAQKGGINLVKKSGPQCEILFLFFPAELEKKHRKGIEKLRKFENQKNIGVFLGGWLNFVHSETKICKQIMQKTCAMIGPNQRQDGLPNPGKLGC